MHPTLSLRSLRFRSKGEMLLEFRDCLELADSLSSEFIILSVDEACAPLSSDLLTQLGPAELKNIRYWIKKPARVGDLVFKWWDQMETLY